MGPEAAAPASTRSKSNSGKLPAVAPTTRKKGAAATTAAETAAVAAAAELANAKRGGGGGGSAVPGGGGGAVKGRDSGKTKKAAAAAATAGGGGGSGGRSGAGSGTTAGSGGGGSDNSYSVGRKRVRVADEKLGEFYVMLTTYEGGTYAGKLLLSAPFERMLHLSELRATAVHTAGGYSGCWCWRTGREKGVPIRVDLFIFVRLAAVPGLATQAPDSSGSLLPPPLLSSTRRHAEGKPSLQTFRLGLDSFA